MKFSLWNLKEWYEVHGLDLSYHITESDASISMLAVSDTAAEGRLGPPKGRRTDRNFRKTTA